MRTHFHLLTSSLLFAAVLFNLESSAQTSISKAERKKIVATTGKVKWKDTPIRVSSGVELGAVKQTTIRSSDFDTSTFGGMRLHFRINNGNPQNEWLVKVKAGNKVVSIHSSFTDPSGSFWSGEIEGDEASVEFLSLKNNAPFEMFVDGIATRLQIPTFPKSIYGANELTPFDSAPDSAKEIGKSVARIRFVSDDGDQYVCTGFLISSDLFMTNDHCPQSESEWRSTYVDFDYDRPGAAVKNDLKFKERLLANGPLDVAIYRLTTKQANRRPLVLDPIVPAPGAFLMIVQHPGGQPKQVSFTNCKIQGGPTDGVTSAKTDIAHECDTLGGSSGSEVIEVSTGKVVALHHFGFTPGFGLQANRAVLMQQIVDFIRNSHPALKAELGL